MIRPAERLKNIEEYYFSYKLREIQNLNSAGRKIINLGIGNPDLLPPTDALKAISNAIFDINKHGYQPYNGIQELRQSISAFYIKKYNVVLNMETQILPLFGAKEGIMHISMAYLNKGESVLIPDPGYATYSSVTKLLESNIVYYNLKFPDWTPDFQELEDLDLSKIKIIWINYPHMPTGSKASYKVFEKIIEFGKKHNILIVNDNPYSFILTENPLSILQVDGAIDIAVELNSLSKTFNMAGWRVGMIVGNTTVISNVLKVKSNIDSGMFYGIQAGAIAALNSENVWYQEINNIYSTRRDVIWKIAEILGYSYDKKAEGFFVWCKFNSESTSYEESEKLMRQYDIFVTPGDIFGKNGAKYLRFSLCVNESELKEILCRIQNLQN
jgi:LL-diaminopimelate aminotransferase